ncbi:NAD(P)-binding protein [Xylariaceae sp. FL0804]|nr:NAD(P)-binding protein [Xylariaceae sp. FL0804]
MSSASPKVIFVTGANQGLGFSIIQVAALRDPESTYILASRRRAAGEEAVEKLRELGVTARIEVVELDVTKDEQIAAAVDVVKSKFGKLDVLVNNAGIIGPMHPPPTESLAEMRARYSSVLDTNLTSVAVLTHALTPALHAAAAPRVINVSSGLGSMTNALTRRMGRHLAYGASKVGMNGLTVHLQVQENDRVEAAAGGGGGSSGAPRIKTFMVAPGVLRTAFTGFHEKGKDPAEGAEAIVRLALEETKFEGGSYLEWDAGELKRIPW